MPRKNYSEWSKEDLVREIKKFEKRKKYGIVWEDKPEQVALFCKEKLPVLVEDKKKEIITDKEKPVHILIEGDNYHALSVLNYTHKGKIDVIYIDPPYNTGNYKEWKYNDKWVDREDAYRHSKWLSFMSKRLELAKKLLSDKGIIFISIDDNELGNLRALCDEIFGEQDKFIPKIVWYYEGVSDNEGIFKRTHENVLVYARDKSVASKVKENPIIDPGMILPSFIENSVIKNGPANPPSQIILPRGFPAEFRNGFIDPKNVTALKLLNKIEVHNFKLTNPARVVSGWSSRKILQNFIDNKFSPVMDSENQETTFFLKKSGNIFYKKRRARSHLLSVITSVGTTMQAGKLLKGMGLNFDYPKPIGLIKHLINVFSKKNSIVLDFFAGSGTTGHAVLELNKEDYGHRTFVLCTNNENNICTDVCYPRIKKIISGYKNLKGEKIKYLGSSLKYFKTDFVDAEPTDKNKKKMVDKSTEMLCLKENCFDEVEKGHNFRVFTNNQGKSLGIIYDDDGIEPFKKEVKKLKEKFVVYVFSLDESAREEEFEDVEDLVELKPIPAVILNVYKRIFK